MKNVRFVSGKKVYHFVKPKNEKNSEVRRRSNCGITPSLIFLTNCEKNIKYLLFFTKHGGTIVIENKSQV